jgi:SGNH hydrolase-like domain, acetyltransferase AlgX
MTDARPAWKTGLDAALVVVFLAAIATPAALFASTHERTEQEQRELRQPARFPADPVDLQTVRDWPRGFEEWYSDRFALRSWLLLANNWLKLILFRSSPDPMVEPGGDGFLLNTNSHALEDIRGTVPLSPELVQMWVDALEDRRQWCEERGIHYAVVWAPSGTQIYPESVPHKLFPLVGPTRLDQLCAALQSRAPELDWLDLRAPLLEERARNPDAMLYRKLDPHWNARGVLVAYEAILADLQRTFPPLRARPRSDFVLREEGIETTDWAHRLYLEDVFSEPRLLCQPRFATRARVTSRQGEELEVTELNAPSLPSVVVFHDSYGASLRPLLREHFRRAEFHWRTDFVASLVERAQPDLVLTVLSEPNLFTSRPAVWPGDDQARLAEQFARSDESLLALSPTQVDERLLFTRGVSFEPVVRTDGPGLLLHSDGVGYVILPEFPLPAGRVAMLHLRMSLQRAGTVEVDFCTDDDDLYTRYSYSRTATLPVQAGPNDLYVKLHVPDLRGNVRFRVPNAKLALFSEIEVRAVPPGDE